MTELNKKSVLKVIKNSDQPLSTKKIADNLEVDWHTAKKKLDKLEKTDNIYKVKWRTNLTLYWDRPIF